VRVALVLVPSTFLTCFPPKCSSTVSTGQLTQDELVRPLQIMMDSNQQGAKEHTLQGVFTLLQLCGHKLHDGWPKVLHILQLAAESSVHAAIVGDDQQSGTRSRSIVTSGFKSVRLVVDDYLTMLPVNTLHLCFSCIGAYGSQEEDVNISLTAVNMFLTIADYIREELIRNSNMFRATTGDETANSRWDKMWTSMFGVLSRLSLDFRPDVRNSALRILFSVVTEDGDLFDYEQWRKCMEEVMFPLIESIQQSADHAEGEDGDAVIDGPELGVGQGRKVQRLEMHHSRNTAAKQWNETRVLVLKGSAQILRRYVVFCKPCTSFLLLSCTFARDHETWIVLLSCVSVFCLLSFVFVFCLFRYTTKLVKQAWFCRAWDRFLELILHSILLGSTREEVALAGVKALQGVAEAATYLGPQVEKGRGATAGSRVQDGAVMTESPGLSSAAAAGSGGSDGDLGAEDDVVHREKMEELWTKAWDTMRGTSSVTVDDECEVTCAMVKSLEELYKICWDHEFAPPARMRELLVLLQELIAVRPDSRKSDPVFLANNKRPIFTPPVSNAQRAMIKFVGVLCESHPFAKPRKNDIRSTVHERGMLWDQVIGLLLRCQPPSDATKCPRGTTHQFGCEALETLRTVYNHCGPEARARNLCRVLEELSTWTCGGAGLQAVSRRYEGMEASALDSEAKDVLKVRCVSVGRPSCFFFSTSTSVVMVLFRNRLSSRSDPTLLVHNFLSVFFRIKQRVFCESTKRRGAASCRYAVLV
jgi:hypothetical protein